MDQQCAQMRIARSTHHEQRRLAADKRKKVLARHGNLDLVSIQRSL
jgi:hypothetical protein